MKKIALLFLLVACGTKAPPIPSEREALHKLLRQCDDASLMTLVTHYGEKGLTRPRPTALHVDGGKDTHTFDQCMLYYDSFIHKKLDLAVKLRGEEMLQYMRLTGDEGADSKDTVLHSLCPGYREQLQHTLVLWVQNAMKVCGRMSDDKFHYCEDHELEICRYILALKKTPDHLEFE